MRNPVNVLFVGGPYAGQYRALPAPAPSTYYYPIYGENGQAVEGRYWRRTYPTSRGEAVLYLHQSIDPELSEGHIIVTLLEAKP